MWLKATDMLGAYGCSNCHSAYDRQVKTDLPYEYIQVCFFEGMMRSQRILIEKELIKIS